MERTIIFRFLELEVDGVGPIGKEDNIDLPQFTWEEQELESCSVNYSTGEYDDRSNLESSRSSFSLPGNIAPLSGSSNCMKPAFASIFRLLSSTPVVKVVE